MSWLKGGSRYCEERHLQNSTCEGQLRGKIFRLVEASLFPAEEKNEKRGKRERKNED